MKKSQLKQFIKENIKSKYMENFGEKRVGAQKENEFRKEKKEGRGGGNPKVLYLQCFF